MLTTKVRLTSCSRFRRLSIVQLFLCLCFSCSATNSQVLHEKIGPSCSEAILEAEQLLLKQGFVPGPIDGCLDDATDLALLAYRRAHHLKNDVGLTKLLLEKLRRPKLLRPHIKSEPHVEVNVYTQLIYWVPRNGVAENIVPVAIGSGRSFQLRGRQLLAVTPRGTFNVYRKIEGWHVSPLGSMYYSSYIKGGVAIHGRNDFSSHSTTYGCIAIPMFAAIRFFELMPLDSKVIVFGKSRSKKFH